MLKKCVNLLIIKGKVLNDSLVSSRWEVSNPKETLLVQYQSECLSALKSMANIHKPLEKTILDTMKLLMAIPVRINFLQLGRYGWFSEQTYRHIFEQTSESWIFTSMRRLQPSTWPKRHVRGSE